ncbi:hypothetical protein QE152_g22122 [Popillia japonica]|uniref:C2H2-type domain-containing protein n=1 Tax=Popillia japonica TaxID=7064 RepID=A0AAW1KMY1_POPJA
MAVLTYHATGGEGLPPLSHMPFILASEFPRTFDDETVRTGSRAQTTGPNRGAVPQIFAKTAPKPEKAGIRPPVLPQPKKHGAKKDSGSWQGAANIFLIPRTFGFRWHSGSWQGAANIFLIPRTFGFRWRRPTSPKPYAVHLGATDNSKSLGRGEFRGPNSPGLSETLDDKTARTRSSAQTTGANRGAVPNIFAKTVPKPEKAGIRPPVLPQPKNTEPRRILALGKGPQKHGAKKDSGSWQGAANIFLTPRTFGFRRRRPTSPKPYAVDLGATEDGATDNSKSLGRGEFRRPNSPGPSTTKRTKCLHCVLTFDTFAATRQHERRAHPESYRKDWRPRTHYHVQDRKYRSQKGGGRHITTRYEDRTVRASDPAPKREAGIQAVSRKGQAREENQWYLRATPSAAPKEPPAVPQASTSAAADSSDDQQPAPSTLQPLRTSCSDLEADPNEAFTTRRLLSPIPSKGNKAQAVVTPKGW